MNLNENFNERQYIYIVKAIALCSIVFAHVGAITNNSILNKIFTFILSSIGTVGVGVFFLISGYLYLKTKKAFLQFCQSRIKIIIIPWIFCGTLDFLYIAFRKGGLNFYNWFISITVHSHLYYLTILIIFYLLFWKFKNNLAFLLSFTVLSVISITLTGLNLIPIYPYINPFNWAIYFIIGLLMKRYSLLEKTVMLCKKWILVIAGTYLIILNLYLINGISVTYWKYAAIIAELVAITFVFGTSCYCLYLKKVKWIVYLGKMSFSIYLLHMPFAGIFTNLCNKFNLWYLSLLIPFIVIISTVAGIETFRYISKRMGIGKILDLLIGINRADGESV